MFIVFLCCLYLLFCFDMNIMSLHAMHTIFITMPLFLSFALRSCWSHAKLSCVFKFIKTTAVLYNDMNLPVPGTNYIVGFIRSHIVVLHVLWFSFSFYQSKHYQLWGFNWFIDTGVYSIKLHQRVDEAISNLLTRLFPISTWSGGCGHYWKILGAISHVQRKNRI